MAQNTIFRKVQFTCGGCGQKTEAKMQVPASEARTPLAMPSGWGCLDVVGQHAQYGAITVLSVPICSEACGRKLAAADGVPEIVAYVKACQTVFSDGERKVIVAPTGKFDPPVSPY